MQAQSLSLIPPDSGGVRDYASILGGALGAPIQELTPHTDTTGWSGDMLLLHFSGYGFQKRGVPSWLPAETEKLRSKFKAFGVVFHELYASGPPWRSAFWLSGVQKRIARELLRQADFWLSNREGSAQWLRSQALTAKPHRVLPVFSNVGEPSAVDDERDATIVVFGSEAVRSPVYTWNDGEIFRFARRHGLRIHDMGKPVQNSALAGKLAEEAVITRGMLPSDEVSQVLSSARYGAVVYPPDYASKSGIFAAYAAHGMCPVLLWKNHQPHDGMQPNIEYAAGFEAFEGARDIDPWLVGRSARRWYDAHRSDAHVEALQRLYREVRA